MLSQSSFISSPFKTIPSRLSSVPLQRNCLQASLQGLFSSNRIVNPEYSNLTDLQHPTQLTLKNFLHIVSRTPHLTVFSCSTGHLSISLTFKHWSALQFSPQDFYLYSPLMISFSPIVLCHLHGNNYKTYIPGPNFLTFSAFDIWNWTLDVLFKFIPAKSLIYL